MATENKPEGLKKIRNPERTVRIAVGYTGHTPPKSDDADANNEPGQLKIYLPKKLLECLPKCSSLPKERHRWNTNEEIAAYLITFEKHEEWLTTSPKTRPQNGSMILYNRKKVKYRKDGYCWKKRKDGKTTREDHMKLKVQGVECLYGCYVHSSIIPTFHRRCYWLLQNPDIVLVHYLNVPAVDDSGKPCGPVLCSINTDRKEWAKWSKEELIGQLKPMCAGSSLHQKCSSVKQRIISSKQEPGAGVEKREESEGSEVQNSDVSEGQTETTANVVSGRSRGSDRRNGRLPKPSLLPQSSMEVSSSTNTAQVEVPDTTQNSPLSMGSDMADSPALSSMGAGLNQSTAVFMSEVTTLTGDAVYSTGHTHLLGPAHEGSATGLATGILLTVTPENSQRFHSFSGGVGLGDGGELVLSSSLDSTSGVSLPETTMTFDPDCFLNNPKQGQTYGGGKNENCNRSDELHCPVNVFYNAALVNNIKTEATNLEQPLANASGYESTGLSPSTTLEQMDFSAVMSSSLAQQAHHSSPSLFLQTSPQTNQALPSNSTEASQEESQNYIALSSVSNTSPVTTNRAESHAHLQQANPEQRTMCGRNSALNGSNDQKANVVDSNKNLMLKSEEAYATGVKVEHYLQEENPGREEGGANSGESEILCNGVTSVGASPQSIAQNGSIDGSLYNSPMPQQGVTANTNTSGAGISLEGFEASFGSQFSDLINDFISVEGSGAGVGGAVMMTQEAGGPEDQGSAQTHLQGTGVEQASLGLLQETGRLFGVTDYSPEWSYPEGGVKVLITGPWLESTSDYSCFFDHISVPAALIQPGVLRCYCPAHDTGLVMLQVAMGGDVISSSVVFEYKARDLPALPSSQHDWLSLDDAQFRMSILERLEQMEQRMAEISNPNPNSESTDPKGGGAEGGATEQVRDRGGGSKEQSSFEARVLSLCEQMMAQSCWGSGSDLDHSKNSRGMTLLHLAAAQGYAGLINALRRWRTKHSGSIELELEVDPLNVDHFSCTPLMWACALGHTDSALLLYHWDHRALSIPDSLGRLPLTIARSRGHTHLAELLEQTPPSTSSASSSSGTQRPAHTTKGQQSDSGSEQRGHTEVKTETQPDPKSWSQTQPQEDPPPAKRPKPSADTPLGQQLAPLPPGPSTLTSLLTSSTKPTPLPCITTPHLQRTLPRPQAGTGGSGGPRWGPAQRSVVRRIMGKERLAGHLRHRVVGERGDTELLSIHDNSEEVQMDLSFLTDHIMEATSERLKQEPVETEIDSRGAGLSSDVTALSGCLSDVERFLHPGPPSPVLRRSSLSGEQPPQTSSPELRLLKDPGPKSPASRFSMSESERAELYESIRLALLSLRKNKGPLQEQRKEIAAVIQRCYKRYKQFALYKRMTLAAVLIQSRFRSLIEQKKFQQSRRAAVLIQQYYRSYRHSLSRLLSKKQNQAARKILKFLLRCRHSPMLDHRPLKQGQRAEKGQGS
ncbi:calmodulin-binding transcription activator 1-like [Periophthalmus magnuspinnatus]|uniref:calmodulin-binding transcription activator 1-like n=1 Tax=Periophthalmus magnuspinnatus TaxID=409849 RepID=UPI002436A8AC|nr:calmodulin-binding transcription activator 1-like [Periophthalmus magnuspinnatus]